MTDRSWIFEGYKQCGILASNQKPELDNKLISLVKFGLINQSNARIPYFSNSQDLSVKHLWSISKIIHIAVFTPRVITISQCPIRILDCRLNSRIPLFHWSLSESYDAWCKRRSRDHFRFTKKAEYNVTNAVKIQDEMGKFFFHNIKFENYLFLAEI